MVKVTLITGASSGFGEEFAKLFAKFFVYLQLSFIKRMH